MGMVRKTLFVFSAGLIRARSKKQRVAAKTLRASRRTARATETLARAQESDYGSGYDQWGR